MRGIRIIMGDGGLDFGVGGVAFFFFFGCTRQCLELG